MHGLKRSTCTRRNAATKRILTLPNRCRQEFQTCSYIKELNDNQAVAAVMRCECDANPWRIEKPLGDNNTGFQNFFENVLKVPRAFVILTSPPFLPAMGHSRSASNRRICTSDFMSWCCLKDCSNEDAGVKLQDRLCHWLAEKHEDSLRRRSSTGSLNGCAGP